MQTVLSLEAARVALRSGVRDLASPSYAACHSGVHYYQVFLQQLRQEFPDMTFRFTLCCGDDPAIAHDALRMGFSAIRCACSDGMAAQLEAIAGPLGATVIRG